MATHALKTEQGFFDLVSIGVKTFELRQYTEQACAHCESLHRPVDVCRKMRHMPRPARDFKVNDLVHLMNLKDSTETLIYKISYILWDKDFPQGIQEGWCILALEDV